jgi:hypothetical protein
MKELLNNSSYVSSVLAMSQAVLGAWLVLANNQEVGAIITLAFQMKMLRQRG